jgi:hypothetical protein
MPDIPVDQPLGSDINHQDEQNQSRPGSIRHFHGDPLSGEDIKMDGHGSDGREEGCGHR